jgi:hypothetical protein
MIENLTDAIPVDVPNAQDPDGRDLGAAKGGNKNSRSGRGIKQLAMENRDYFFPGSFLIYETTTA